MPAQFDLAGQQLAEQHGAPATELVGPSFFPRLQANVALLQRAEVTLAAWAAQGQAVGPAGDWLLDHIASLAAQTRAVRDGLPRRYYQSLPVLAGTPLAGTPRVLAIAWAYVEASDSLFDLQKLQDMLLGYQRLHRLTLGELWALPTTLRVVLIENLRRIVERVLSETAARSSASLLFETQAHLPAALAGVAARGVLPSFALQLLQGLHGEDAGLRPPEPQRREAIRAALDAALPDPVLAQTQQQASEAADAHSVAQAIGALQALDRADWPNLVARSSHTLQALERSPVYLAEAVATQDEYLHALERLARRSGREELAVAEALLSLLPRAEAGQLPAEAAPGHWLLGPGRARLYGLLGLSTTRLRWAAVSARAALPLYLLSLFAASVALALFSVQNNAGWVAGALAALLAWLPASEAVALLLQRLLAEWLPARHAPRMALAGGIPPEHAVMVVIPALLHEGCIAALTQRLQAHYLANRETHAQFALLTDFEDAQAGSLGGDGALLNEAIAAIDALEAAHPPALGAPRRFLLLHRERTWSPTERAWIGWERKRGKLAQLLECLALDGPSPFVRLGPRSQARSSTAHVLTLDADTQLPPGSLRALVGVAAHPLNQPRLDASGRRVVAGHAILQPRVDAAWPSSAQATPFHRLFAGGVGTDPYHSASSEAYNDLFDEASFSGKGLLHVAAMHAVLGGRLPPEQVLSHDLVEGIVARCGAVSDVVLAEPAPAHPLAASSRLHRWTRGDWQLLPLLRRPRHYGLNALGVWKLVDNLRRSLVAPAALLLLLLALASAVPVGVGSALALALAALAGGPVLGALAGLAPQRDDLALQHFVRAAGGELLRALAAGLWLLALWPRQAALNLGAIGRALWRSHVSRRHLLQWTASARVEAELSRAKTRRASWVWPLAALALGLGLVLLAGAPWPITAALCLLWAATPYWLDLGGRAEHRPPSRLSPPQQAELRELAESTWRYFDTQVGPSTHHLPPDNVQTLPRTVVATRTSPTNIGLYLMALACARSFGWVSEADALMRVTATLDTLERLPRHRGHVLNWIDTSTLLPLPPAYVSTVDSGNLCVCLVGLAGALKAFAAPEAALLAARCLRLAQEPDFSFLYDTQRRLLRIGWRVQSDTHDSGHYDLLASEARLGSLWAIAKGDVPAQHWAALGRPIQASGSEVGLRSWSGSMFEYLLPPLLLHEPVHSLLGRSARMAVAEQRHWAEQRRLPWGVSECAHAVVDESLNYQYGPQGVPRLALRRAPSGEHVIAPYASAMALPIAPLAALANLQRLARMGARGPWGFLEALDFSPSRNTQSEQVTPVATTMAHHQGMVLLALADVLLNGQPARWTMAEPQLAAVASLLHERVPREVARVPAALPTVPSSSSRRAEQPRRWRAGEDAVPPTALLSNGRLSAALRPSGAGWVRFEGADLNRWRDDALRDAYGPFLFVQRNGTDVVSLTQHPAPDPAARYSAVFEADRIHFEAQWSDLRLRCSVWINPVDDVLLQQVEVWNTSAQALELTLFSAFEPSLSAAAADETHPAFANLFLRATWDAATKCLHLQRQPRREDEKGLHLLHFVAHADSAWQAAWPLADRTRWQGRLREVWQPRADFSEPAPPSEAGAQPLPTGLDPVAALRLQLQLPAHGHARLQLGTAAARDASSLQLLRERCQAAGAMDLAQSAGLNTEWPGQAPARLGDLPLSAEDSEALNTLCTALVLLLSRPAARSAASEAADAPAPHSALWRLGLSGERPLLSLQITSLQGLRSLRQLLQGLRQWARAGVVCDMVLINQEPPGYFMPLQQALRALKEQQQEPQGCCARLHLWMSGELSTMEARSLALHARVRLQLDGRSLERLLAPWLAWHQSTQSMRSASHRHRPASWHALPDIATPLPGAFSRAGTAYRFTHSGASPTPRPWVNVLANPDFGAIVSEVGGSCTWADNSRLAQLTAWSNDPLADFDGEALFLQDLASGVLWQMGRSPLQAPVETTHEAGLSTLRQDLGGLQLSLRFGVDASLPFKRVQIELHNPGPVARRLRCIGVVEWLMGADRAARRSLHTQRLEQPTGPLPLHVLVATQRDADGQPPSAFVAFHHEGTAHARLDDWTCDRRELFDDTGRRVLPDLLGQQAGNGLDPCAAAALSLRLPGGGSASLQLIIGQASSPAAALALAAQALAVPAHRACGAMRRPWRALQAQLRVHSPDPLFDALVNHWLLYQTVACRMWARASFYQAGGAYGYRDQLQDAMALDHAAPELLHAQLLRAAARQFEAGDVQHWWHPPLGAGVRTHFSDDRLWLPHALLHALRAAPDQSLLDATAPFLQGDPVPPNQEDSYTTPIVGGEHASLYEHAARALDVSLMLGDHGMPLMGTGDWNDGMNRVGSGGKGESVWMAWFLAPLLKAFVPLALARGQTERAGRWQLVRHQVQRALQGAAWDGAWYRRAFFDNGALLGSATQSECRIDLIAQAWSVLSGMAPRARQLAAMAATESLLARPGLMPLLTPPLQFQQPSAGYIQAYPPGVRENGGQYNHAAVWALMAQAQLGHAAEAWRLFTEISPAHRSIHPVHGPLYRLEPYAVAADVYTEAPYIGQGGWSWTTGSAAWLYRAALGSILGLQREGSRVRFAPCLPPHWPQAKLVIRHGGQRFRFHLLATGPAPQGAKELLLGDWLDMAHERGGAWCVHLRRDACTRECVVTDHGTD